MLFEVLDRFAGPLRDFFDARNGPVTFGAQQSAEFAALVIVIYVKARNAALAHMLRFGPADRAASFLFPDLFFVPLDRRAGMLLEIVAAVQALHPATMGNPKSAGP